MKPQTRTRIKIEKEENFLRSNYRKSFRFLRQSSSYISAAVAIFFIIGIFGFMFPIFFQEDITKFVEQTKDRFEGKSTFDTAKMIFLNNLSASFFAMTFGIFFGIFPVIALVTNGYLLGFVARKAIALDGIFVLWRLFPHGIFELPAVLLSIGIGLRLGFDFLKERNFSKLKINFRESLRLFIFIVIPLLIIAAIIEGVLVVYLR